MAGWKIERRRTERFKIGWTGRLTCYFPEHEEDVEVRVVEVSADGARLEIDTLKAGQYHIVIGSESSRFTLKVSLPEAALSIPVRIIWYSTDQEKDAFTLGVLFLKTSAEVQKTIESILKDVALGAASLGGRGYELSRSKDFQAVIFDLDGTLLDTLQDLADSMNGTLSHFGFPVHELEKYRYFVGDGMENLVRRSLPDSVKNDPETISRCLEMMRKAYALNWKAKTRPYPGVPELLDALSRRGLKMAVLSNKPHDFTRKVVEGLLPARLFETVVGARPQVPLKPDPSAALEIANGLGIEPARFLYMGDTATDMKTANAAGMFAVGALWGFRDAAELTAAGAAKLAGKPAELLELL